MFRPVQTTLKPLITLLKFQNTKKSCLVVPSVMIPGTDYNSTAPQVGIGEKNAKNMDILQVTVSILIPR